jgi:hypothetical protein
MAPLVYHARLPNETALANATMSMRDLSYLSRMQITCDLGQKWKASRAICNIDDRQRVIHIQ